MRFLRLGIAGMRGEVGTGINPLLAMDYAAALGTMVDGGTVVVGTDTRFSSPMFARAVRAALASCGCDVVDTGILPAPAVQFLVSRLGASAGLLVGAGHHPAGWNAVVPLSASGAYLNEAGTQTLLDIYHSRRFTHRPWDGIGGVNQAGQADIDAYMDTLCGLFDTDAISKAGFKVIADFCNGSGSKLGASFAERCGVELIILNDDLTGNLPHDPEPRPRSAAQARTLLHHLEANVAFVFNSDMSRASVVTNTGDTLSEEYTFPLAVRRVVARGDASVVVTNTCTTKTLDLVVEELGAKVEKTKVGQAPVVDCMLDIKAGAAGDGSGSFAMSKGAPAFDGFLAMGMVLESMAVEGATSSELADSLPKFHIVKKKVYCPSSHAYTLLRRLGDHFPDAELSDLDGFRFEWEDGWVHLRAAMTEPIIRMIVEWRTREEAEEMASNIRGLVERLVVS